MSPEAKEIAAEHQWHAADALKRAADAQRREYHRKLNPQETCGCDS